MTESPIRQQMRRSLLEAMRVRDATATTALRGTLAAIGNAEAVRVVQVPTRHVAGTISGAVAGLGSGDAARRELSDAELVEIVAAQVEDRVQAADEYERHGEHDAARRLRDEAEVLRSYVSGG